MAVIYYLKNIVLSIRERIILVSQADYIGSVNIINLTPSVPLSFTLPQKERGKL